MLVREKQEKEADAATEMSVLLNSFNMFNPKERKKLYKALENQMNEHAERLEFELAASIRDKILALKEQYGE